MTEMNQKIYCSYCGQEQKTTADRCPYCMHLLNDKAHLLRDYLVRHTKDKLKGDAEDKLYETIKNFLLSHLYGALVTITLSAAVVSAVAARPAPRVRNIDERPVSVRNVLLESEAVPVEELPEGTVVPVETVEPTPTEEPVATPIYDFDSQADVILANYSLWEKPEEYSMGQVYYVTDLDQDGLLEINCQSTMGTGFFTQRVSYEVNETMDGLVAIAPASESDPDTFYTLDPSYADADNVCVGYYDPTAKTYSYIVVDTWRAGAGSHGSVYTVLTMAGNNYQFSTLGTYEYSCNLDGSNEQETYKIDEQSYSNETEFRAALEAKFDGCRKFTYDTTYLSSYDVTDLDAQIRELIKGYYLTLE